MLADLADKAACGHSHVHVDQLDKRWRCVHCFKAFLPEDMAQEMVELEKRHQADLENQWLEEFQKARVTVSLRDQFAMAALPEVCRQVSLTGHTEIEAMVKARGGGIFVNKLCAILSYEMADAMMKAREGK